MSDLYRWWTRPRGDKPKWVRDIEAALLVCIGAMGLLTWLAMMAVTQNPPQ